MADLTPITRKEKYLAKAGGQEVTLPPYPITREEMYLEKIANGGGGSSSDYAASLRMTIDSSTYVVTAQLYNKDGDALGNPQTIDLPLESTVVSGSYDSLTKSLILTLVSGDTVTIPIGDLITGLVSDTDYATTSKAGIVKPDGVTTTVGADGTLSVSVPYFYVDSNGYICVNYRNS